MGQLDTMPNRCHNVDVKLTATDTHWGNIMGDNQKRTFGQVAKVLGVDRRLIGLLVFSRQIPHEDYGTVKFLAEDAIEELRVVLAPPSSRSSSTLSPVNSLATHQ